MDKRLKGLAKNCRKTTYYETLEMYRGKLCTRIWACRRGKVQEVYRTTEDRCWVSGNLYKSSFGGYYVVWDSKNYRDYNDKMYKCYKMWYPNISGLKNYILMKM